MSTLAKILKKALQNPLLAIKVLLWNLQSLLYIRYIDNGRGKIIIRDNSVKLKIRKGRNAKFNLYGNLIVESFKGYGPVIISINDGGRLDILGDFVLGDGVKISIANDALLSFGGKRNESASGITGNTLIMVSKKIEIGCDFICAWDVFISDSDWHSIEGQHHQNDVKIGDHVWIANNNNILKGSIIGDGCIISSFSKVGNREFPKNVLIGGIPAKVLKEHMCWKRDINL